MAPTSQAAKPPRLPRRVCLETSKSEASLLAALAASEEAEVEELRRRLGTWRAFASSLPSSPHAAPSHPGLDEVGSAANPMSQIRDTLAVGFELHPLKASASSPQLDQMPGGRAFNPRRTRMEIDARRLRARSMSGGPDVSELKAAAAPAQARPQSQASSSSTGKWKRQARNRQGCSDEVLSRERRRLEQVVKDCGLLLAPDPQAPGREVLRAAPGPALRRSSQEQYVATRRLVDGLSAKDYQDSRSSVRSLSSSGGSAARFLRSEHQCLQQPSINEDPLRPFRLDRPQSAPGGRAASSQASVSRVEASPLVHGLLAPQSAEVLAAALSGAVPVHLTHAVTSTSSRSSALGSKEGEAPSTSLQVAILAAALRGEIPVHSISIPTTKSGGADAARAGALSTSVGVTEISVSGASSGSRSRDASLDRLLDVGGGVLEGRGCFWEPFSSEAEFEFDEPDQ